MDFILNALHSIGFNWHIALANFINFLIVLFVLNKFVFNKVVKLIKNRENIIKKGLEDASSAEKLLSEAEYKSVNIINEAKILASHNTKESIDHAKKEADLIISESKDEIDSLRKTLKENIQNAENKVNLEFQKSAPLLAISLLSKILKENIDESINNKIVTALSK